MQSGPIVIYRRSWCEDSDAAVAYFKAEQIEYEEVDIEQDEAAAQGVEFVTGGYQITPTLVYHMQAIVFDPWDQARFERWWRFANEGREVGASLTRGERLGVSTTTDETRMTHHISANP